MCIHQSPNSKKAHRCYACKNKGMKGCILGNNEVLMLATIFSISHVPSIKWWARHDTGRDLLTWDQPLMEPSLAKQAATRAWTSWLTWEPKSPDNLWDTDSHVSSWEFRKGDSNTRRRKIHFENFVTNYFVMNFAGKGCCIRGVGAMHFVYLRNSVRADAKTAFFVKMWESASYAFTCATACCSLQGWWSEPCVPPPRYSCKETLAAELWEWQQLRARGELSWHGAAPASWGRSLLSYCFKQKRGDRARREHCFSR